MAKLQFKGVVCTLEAGSFSGQRWFTVTLPDGSHYSGLASRLYCWDESWTRAPELAPKQMERGYVAALVLSRGASELDVWVELPDSKRMQLPYTLLVELPRTVQEAVLCP